MLSTCCPHVVHMLTVRVGRLLFSFESSHGKRRAKVLAFTALRNCAASGFPLVWGLMVCCHDTIQHQTGLVPVNCFKQCLVSRQKKKPGLYEAEYLWTWQTEKNRTLSISFVFCMQTWGRAPKRDSFSGLSTSIASSMQRLCGELRSTT